MTRFSSQNERNSNTKLIQPTYQNNYHMIIYDNLSTLSVENIIKTRYWFLGFATEGRSWTGNERDDRQ